MELANVSIKFSAEGQQAIVSAIGQIQTNTKSTVTALEKMQQTLDKMSARGVAGVNKELEKTGGAAKDAAEKLDRYAKALADAETRSRKYAAAVEQLGAKYGMTDQAVQRWLPNLKKAEEYIRSKSMAMTAAGRNGQAYYDKMDRVVVMEKMLSGQLGTTSKAFRQLKPTIEMTTSAMEKNNAAVSTGAKGIRNLIPHVAAVTLSYMAMRRAVAAVKEAFAAGVDFEQQMALVGGIVRATANDFEMLTAAAREAGETTVWTATEAAQALRYLGMAGFSAAESIESLAGVLNLALIGEMDLGRATDIATDTLRAFGLEASQMNKVVDVFVGTITRSNTNIEKMGQAMKYVAPVASKLGYTIEEVSAMIGVLSQSGIKSGIAGRALRMSFLKSADAAEKLGIESTNLIDILKELNNRNLTPVELTSTLKDLFGIRSTPALLTLMQGMSQLEQFTETLRNARGETAEFVERLDTVQVAWEKLKSVMVDVAIEIFIGQAKDLKQVLKDITAAIKEAKPEIKSLFEAFKTGLGIVKDLATGPFALLILEIKSINNLGDLAGISNLFGKIAKNVALVAAPLTGVTSAISNFTKSIADAYTNMYKWYLGIDDLQEESDRLFEKLVEAMQAAARKAAEEPVKLNIFELVDIGRAEEAEMYITENILTPLEELMASAGVKSASAYMEAFSGGLEEAGYSLEESEISKEAEKIAAIPWNGILKRANEEWRRNVKERESIRDTEIDATIQQMQEEQAEILRIEKEIWESWKNNIKEREAYRNEDHDAAIKIMLDYNQADFQSMEKRYEEWKIFIKKREQDWNEEIDLEIAELLRLSEAEYQIFAKREEFFLKWNKARFEDTQDAIDVQIQEYFKLRDAELAADEKKKQDAKKFYDDLMKLDREYSNKMGDLLDEFVDGPYKDYILEQANLTLWAEKEKLDATEAGSKEALEVIKNAQSKAIAVVKDGLSKQKKYYKDLYDYRYKNENELAAQYAEENLDQKDIQDTLDWMEKAQNKKETYRNDELQAMKSLYKALGEVSGNYFDAQIQIIALEKEKYIESLHLKNIAYKDATDEQKALFDALARWQILKQRELVQEYLIANKGMVGGVVAYLIQMRTEWENYYQQIGQFAYDAMDKMGTAFEDSMVALFREGTDAAKDVWKDFLDDLLDSFIKMIAKLAKELVLSGVLQILASAFGASSSGGASGVGVLLGSSTGTGSSSGSQISMGTLMSLAGTAYEAYAGEAFSTTLMNLFGAGSATAGVGAGMSATYGGASFGYIAGAAPEMGMSLTAGGAGGTAAGGTLASVGAAAGWAAVAVAVELALMTIINNQMKPNASITATVQNGMSEFTGNLFNTAITGLNAVGYSEGDAKKEGKEIATKIAEHFNMYELLYQNVSKESQAKIKAGVSTIPWDDLTFSFVKVAQDSVEPYLVQSYKSAAYQRFKVGAPGQNAVADLIGYGTTTTKTGKAATMLNNLMGRYFTEFIDEALTNIKAKDIYKLMGADVTDAFGSLNVDMFTNDPEEFFRSFNEAMKNMMKAENVWKDFNNWLGNTTKGMTNADAAMVKANAELEGYKAQMEALGLTMSEADIVAKFKEIYNDITDSISGLSLLSAPVSDLDKYLASINGQFDAYLAALEKYGVDLSKIEDLEEMRAKKLKEAAEEYTRAVTAAMESALESVENLIGDLEEGVRNITKTFRQEITNLADRNNLDEAGVNINDPQAIIDYYDELIGAKEEELKGVWEPINEEIATVTALLAKLQSDDPSQYIEEFITYFEALGDAAEGTGETLEGLAVEMSGSFKNALNDLNTQIRLFDEVEGGYNAARAAERFRTALQDFANSLSADMTVDEAIAGLDEVIANMGAYRDTLNRVLDAVDTDGFMNEAKDYARAALSWLDGMETMINAFKTRLEAISKAPVADIAAEAAKSLDGVTTYLNHMYYSFEDAGHVMDQIQEQTKDFSEKINTFIDSLSIEGISDTDIIANFTAMTDSLDTLIASLEDMAPRQSGSWKELINSYLSYLYDLRDTLDYFETELANAGDNQSSRDQIAQILKDLNQGDYTSAIEYLKAQLEYLKAGGGSAEEIQDLNDEITRLQDLQKEYIELQERQLDAIKRSLGLLNDQKYRDDRYEKLKDRYSEFGLDPSDVDTAQAMIDAFANADLETVKKWAEALGITWEELAEDIAFLVEQEQKLYNIRKAQAELAGKDTGVWEVAERYGLNYDAITAEWVSQLVADFLSMTAEQVRDWADRLGVSSEQLVADIMTLANAFDATADAAQSLAAEIRQNLEDLRQTIMDDAGVGGGHAARASSIWNQIVDLGNTEPMTEAILLEMTDKLSDWYSEAKAAEDERIAGIRDELNERRNTLQEELNVAQSFQNVVDSIDELVKSIKYSTLNVSLPYQKAEEAQKDYSTLYTAAMTGDIDAIQEYTGFVQTYLQQQQAEYKSSDEYQRIYNDVMGENGDLARVRANAEAQSYDEAILAELESIDSQLENLEPDYSGLLSQFEGMASYINDALNKLVAQEMWLHIDWDSAGSDEVIQALRDILNYYGWEDEVTLTFVGVMLENFSGDFEERMDILKFVAGDSGWESTATLMMLASTTFWDTNTWEDNVKLLGFILDENNGDWSSKAVLTFMANESAWDSTTWEQAMYGLGYLLNTANLDWESDAVVTWMANDGVWNSSTFENRMELLQFFVDEKGWGSTAFMNFLANDGAWDTNTWEESVEALGFILNQESGNWESDAVITFLSNEGAWDSATWEEAMYGLGYLVSNTPGEWKSTAVLTWLANDALWDSSTFEEQMSTLGYVGSSSGWDSDATVAFLATISDDGTNTWQQVADYLESLGLDETTIKNLRVVYDVANSSWDSWEDLQSWLDALEIPTTQQAKVQAAYDATGSEWTSWAAVESALEEFDVDPTVIATIKTQWAEDNPWSDWATVEAMLNKMDIDPTTIQTIKTQFDAAGSDLSLSGLEQLLAGAGLSNEQIATIKSEVSGSVQVDLSSLTDLDYWTASIGLLVWIGDNISEMTKQLGAPYADWDSFTAFAPGIFDWGAAFTGGGLTKEVSGEGGTTISSGDFAFVDGNLKVYIAGADADTHLCDTVTASVNNMLGFSSSGGSKTVIDWIAQGVITIFDGAGDTAGKGLVGIYNLANSINNKNYSPSITVSGGFLDSDRNMVKDLPTNAENLDDVAAGVITVFDGAGGTAGKGLVGIYNLANSINNKNYNPSITVSGGFLNSDRNMVKDLPTNAENLDDVAAGVITVFDGAGGTAGKGLVGIYNLANSINNKNYNPTINTYPQVTVNPTSVTVSGGFLDSDRNMVKDLPTNAENLDDVAAGVITVFDGAGGTAGKGLVGIYNNSTYAGGSAAYWAYHAYVQANGANSKNYNPSITVNSYPQVSVSGGFSQTDRNWLQYAYGYAYAAYTNAWRSAANTYPYGDGKYAWTENVNKPYLSYGYGGISWGPEYALVGEKGPEAHVPLKDGSIPVELSGFDNMIADLVRSMPGDPSEFNAPMTQDVSLAKNFFMVNNDSNESKDERPIYITVEVAGKEFEAEVKAWADDVRVSANRTKGNETRRLYRTK